MPIHQQAKISRLARNEGFENHPYMIDRHTRSISVVQTSESFFNKSTTSSVFPDLKESLGSERWVKGTMKSYLE